MDFFEISLQTFLTKGVFEAVVDPLSGFFIVILGVVAHYVRAVLQDGHGWVEYWSTNQTRSIASLVGAGVGFFLVKEAEAGTFLMYFAVGFLCDSVLNKALVKLK